MNNLEKRFKAKNKEFNTFNGTENMKIYFIVPFLSAMESNRHHGESGLEPHFTKET